MSHNPNRVQLRVWGPYACFTRPEMKAERVSYEAITPSAARGVLEAVYWKPQIRWRIEAIHVLNPICFSNIRRNELGNRGPSARTLVRYMQGEDSSALAQVIEADRQQRATTLLVDVDYLIKAVFVPLEGSEPGPKHYEMFRRRATRGQCFHHPYLGCREFPAHFEWHDGPPPAPHATLHGRRDLGLMLHDFEYEDGHAPKYFRATMVDGVIEIPSPDQPEVAR